MLTTNSATMVDRRSALDSTGAARHQTTANNGSNCTKENHPKEHKHHKQLWHEAHLLFCSTGVSGGDSALVKVLFSSVMRDPEYTPLSSQMDRILPTDLITLRSPSRLEEGREQHGVIDLFSWLHPRYLLTTLKRDQNITDVTHLTSVQASRRTSAKAVR